ncbi:MAG: phenylalanine--tRNA ligase subunit alpha [Actinobacteria bacterium]|nr:phenylalanine--tRNA ligase subunit alpha [Actinomycetota bacterium]MCB9388553.1 phenylalanine--tRNA ligase subunit alpha [Acidimicrobiia bacterium]
MSLAEIESLLTSEQHRADTEIVAMRTLNDLEALERSLLGKTAPASLVKAAFKDLDTKERPEAGKALGAFKHHVTVLLDARRQELAAAAAAQRIAEDRIDVTMPSRPRPLGHAHLIAQVREELEDLFIGMGYEVAEGPEVETDFYNFEALNMPASHPARSMWDTLYVDLGDPGEVLLRTHTSPVQVRVMQNRTPPLAVVAPGRCYRRDTLDARHSPVFHQLEGLVVGEGITFGDLAGTLESFTRAYFGPGITSRLRPSYFPFTEPSGEFDVTCIFCEGSGCSVCSQVGWIEIGGCGMVDPNVFEAVGYDPEQVTGFAFGFGLERMAQMRFGIDHIRAFFDNDVRFLEQF